jgi:AcrR family transcriptional regulator
MSTETTPTTAQQRRTRKAIVEAAGRLLDAGETPSMAQVAAEADVSRRTIYLHFPSVEQLLVDAALGRITDSLDVEGAIDGLEDVQDRVEALVRVVQTHALETEHLGRTIIRLAGRPATGREAPPRGYRRVGWIERALEPARDRLGPDRFEALVSMLTLLIGWEAALVLRDVRNLEPADGVEVTVRAARALVRDALADAV